MGSTVFIGHYEQDNDKTNGMEEIEWVVLANNGKTATLISKYVLDYKPYNNKSQSFYWLKTWEECSLREWLNNGFMSNAFSEDEQEMLETIKVSAHKNPRPDDILSSDPGKATWDTVYLLSIKEAEQLFDSDMTRYCEPTAYAKAKGVKWDEENGGCWWWLRTPGEYNAKAAGVSSYGSISYRGVDVDCSEAVRPVVVIRLE